MNQLAHETSRPTRRGHGITMHQLPSLSAAPIHPPDPVDPACSADTTAQAWTPIDVQVGPHARALRGRRYSPDRVLVYLPFGPADRANLASEATSLSGLATATPKSSGSSQTTPSLDPKTGRSRAPYCCPATTQSQAPPGFIPASSVFDGPPRSGSPPGQLDREPSSPCACLLGGTTWCAIPTW